MRDIIHRFVSYTKRVGRYTIKVEWLDGQWHCWIFGPRLPVGDISIQVLRGESEKLWDFRMARAYGMRFARKHSMGNSDIVM